MIATKKILFALKCLLFFAFIFITTKAHSLPSEKLKFKHITEENGLTNSHIYTIAQDGKGFIWIGTENGLYCYDGYRFKHYLNLPGDTTSINSNVVFKIFLDSHNNLWIGTFMGLMLYNESLDQFIDLNISTKLRNGLPVPINGITEDMKGTIVVSTDIGMAIVDPVSYRMDFVLSGSAGCKYSGTTVTTCLVDIQGNQWISTEDGISRIDVLSDRVIHYNLSDYANRPFVTTYVHRIYQDSKSNIWIATREEGVFMKLAGSEKLIQYSYREEDKQSLGSNETYDIYEDKSGQIWISTNGGGLNLYNRKTQSFVRFRHSANDKNSLLNNNIRTIFEDRQGDVWIVSFQAGINIFINHPQLFRYYDLNSDPVSDYQSSTVCSICAFKKDLLWIGTDGGGLKLMDRKTNSIRTFLPNEEVRGSFPDKVVMAIYKDRYGTFWFGTYQGGLVKFDAKKEQFIAYQNNPSDIYSIRSNFATSMIEDRNGNFWIGTNGGGLNLFDYNSQQFRAYLKIPGNPNSLVDNFINDIIEDHNGDIWIATFWGLSRLNTRQFNFTNYKSDKTKSNSLSHNTVFCLFEDRQDRIWLGTRNGLNVFNANENTFTFYNEKDGLSGNTIYSILDDDAGNLWLSTNNGLTKFNPATEEAITYSESDGLQGNEFYRNSSFKDTNGELFFGGINGFNAFFPDKVKQRYYEPPVVITGFKIFDHEVRINELINGRKILEKSINETHEITLSYADKIFSFEVAAIDYITPENIVYAYKMEGFDEAWNYTDSKYPIISYTNLGPGEYTLIIKAGNKNMIDSITNYEYVKITITPPVWKTWWAYGIYTLIILSLIYLFWQISVWRIKEKNQIRLEILKREKSEELNQSKLRFFTNISHEFRTPLTLIISPLEQLLSKKNDLQPIRKQLDIMLKNARRMLRLINQLLDFRKIEGGKMTLKAEYSDIIDFISDIIHSFEELALEKRINFKFNSPVEKFMIWFDPDKLDKILFNLLSNAFKFTPEKGSIALSIVTNIKSEGAEIPVDEYLGIIISDTGSGIPEKDFPNLFERFYQADSKHSLYQGSGLGLSLTKNFIDIHQGKITVNSSPAGTTFTVLLPSGDKHLTDAQKVTSDSPGVNKYIHISPELPTIPGNGKIEKQIKQLHNKPTVLLVEDHLDLRNYIENECKDYYNFYSASDGIEGYEMAIDILPDLIISDVMMPGMDGLEFCQKVKMNIVTSHVPVILLTSKNSIESQIEGFESGADAYMAKPFTIDQLIATANSIIENRIRLRDKFNTGKLLTGLPVANTADDKFFQKVTDAINSNLSEVEFGVLELSKLIGISRVHLHRKLKAIANISPNELIKNIRLQKAGELLLQQEFTISEVCYKVGFNSPAYFSSCFKSFYQLSPTEFIEKNIRNNHQ
jgi:signal transduction histidine kinase/ligand-binding sensor domain-containing protein/DNA-binding response OmpR family regulator